MIYGICNLSIVPIRKEPLESSEMVSQLLFGEHFTIIEKDKKWSKIKVAFDGYEGFIDNKQFTSISESEFQLYSEQPQNYTVNLVDFLVSSTKELVTIPIGSVLPFYENNALKVKNDTFSYDGNVISGRLSKKEILNTAFIYLNTPFLWGGKTPFGIDCSGFTQMVYKLCGYYLPRDASEQALEGEVLSFIEESEPGDLAFFDNEEGEIIHVGIILKDYNIIHAHGKVRIDTLDHSGIFNAELQTHTHKLRVIKKII